ncbi:MAG TPA: hypothetical protein VMG60_07280 [Burkholderiaceae bacterium]|nr:hypothetical protein [Burkholderiaceae bacterium]
MAGPTGSNAFPFTAVAVVVAFISSVLLVQKPFELLRPPETAKAQYRAAHSLQIDARLWEDPFTALQRFEAERVARCKDRQPPLPPECDEQELAQRRSVAHLIRKWPEAPDTKRLLLPVLLPGNPFVGAEEARRRTRYAILAGLNAQGYVPNDAEQIELIDFEQVSEEKGRRPRRVAIPYERLQPPQTAPKGAGGRAYDEVLLLWVDEAGLREPKLDNFARLLEQFAAGCALPGRARKDSQTPCADLAVIGPSNSDALRRAVEELREASPATLSPPTVDGYRYLALARIFNSAATADAPSLGVDVPTDEATQPFDTQLLDFIKRELKRVIGTDLPATFAYRSTIAGEDALVSLLISELNARGASTHGGRVVLLSEWDSLHAQALVDRLRARLGATTTHVAVEVHNYLRGIDGVIANDDTKPAAAGDKSLVEWPESRDQRDYLRRLAEDLAHTSRGEAPVGAIGILGSDVHDKLLALQALHDAFPDKTFFTTDLDARFLHPRTLPFTRNLIVATSLPLGFDDASLQGTAPPFRDVTQTSTFLAARLAAGGSVDGALLPKIANALANPRLYEIGLDGPVLLGTLSNGAGTGSEAPTLAEEIGVAALMAAAVLLLAFRPSTPAVRRARESLAHPVLKLGEDGRIVASFVAAHCAALVFAFASLIELVWPGHVTIAHALVWSAVAGAAAFSIIYPGPCWFVSHSPLKPPRWVGDHPATGIAVRLLILLVAVAVALAEVPSVAFGIFEPVLWLQGASGWPSQLLRLLALLAALAAMDYAWFGTLTTAERMSADLGFEESTLFRMARSTSLRVWMRNYSIATWRYPRGQVVDFETLWIDYRHRGRSWARLVRVLFWSALTGVFLYWLFSAFGDGYRLEVPVRGDEHRGLMRGTIVLVVVAFVLLVVATADATMLACRFASHLARGRSVYPDHVIERFAAGMGPTLEAAWRTRITTAGANTHTLLDDWIDIQILARRSADIAPLIMLPAIVLAVLVVAHSRLFDNWALTPSVALMFSFYLLWLVTLATVLKLSADRARRDALGRMRADLRWLQGAKDDLAKLAKPMEGLIAGVEAERRGAFADLFDQPLVKAILVPLGGAGGVQLLDYFLLAK